MEKVVIMDLINYYQNKKIFVTGHTGFKGSWLITWLHYLGAVVKGYALSPVHENDLFNLISGDDMCESVIADIRDKERLAKEIHSFKPDYIFHLAAQPLVGLSYQLPAITFEVNTLGTVHVLDALRYLSSPCIAVIITTDKVYENLETGHHYKETDRLGGYDPYSASKACSELVIDSYRQSFFNPSSYNIHRKAIASARAGNVIGGGDWAQDRIIPDIVRSLHKNQPVVLRNPSSVRPWQHVLEPLEGYLKLAASLNSNPVTFAGPYNFGPYPENSQTVGVLAKKAIESWGGGGLIITEKNDSAVHEAGLLHLDINKALSAINWKPMWDIDTTVDSTISWYKSVLLNKKDARELLQMEILKKNNHD
jgi:CDP-glucose 4,6-dehydratase